LAEELSSGDGNFFFASRFETPIYVYRAALREQPVELSFIPNDFMITGERNKS
jgi:hypothetical protein